jgi:hypothetical protein
MRRRLRHLAIFGSLLVSFAVAVFWLRGLWRWDGLDLNYTDERRGVLLGSGAVEFHRLPHGPEGFHGWFTTSLARGLDDEYDWWFHAETDGVCSIMVPMWCPEAAALLFCAVSVRWRVEPKPRRGFPVTA